MQIKPPRLYRNRCGVFYFRDKSGGRDRRISLRTKCPNAAAIIALQLNLDVERRRAMANPKLSDFNFDPELLRRYEIALKNGTVFRTDGSADDHARAMQMLAQIEKIGAIEPELQPLISATRPSAPATKPKSPPLHVAIDKWLAQSRAKNAERTVQAKEYHVKDFLERSFSHVESVARWLAERQNTEYKRKAAFDDLRRKPRKVADVEANEVDKARLVDFKDALFAEGQSGKTIDNKLMSLHDLLKYMIAHGHYTASESNPVAGLFVESKSERRDNAEPYEPFSEEALKILFEPKAYLGEMDEPDFFWAPLLGIFTGMRISEATAIRVEDFHEAKGVHYIHIPKSKTSAGVRNVPVCDSLIQLGLLDYVEECRKAGAERIFPHCAFINGSHSKYLSEKLLAYQRAHGIKAPHTSFHSFRVNVITAMSNNGANTAQLMKIVGHKKSDANEVHLGYVRDLPDLKKVVDALEWPVDVAALRYAGRFEAFVSDKANWADGKPSKGQ